MHRALRLHGAMWAVALGAPVVYWLVSLQYSGPLYLADEIGYLSNAAFLAGHRLDAASSFHAGYSLFLAPLFVLLSDPAAIWRGVMTVNALFWVLAFLVLARLLQLCFPTSSSRLRAGVLLVCALYPAWITMSGYALVTSAMACLFLCSLLAFAQWRPAGAATSLLPHSLCVGFLYWIHPTGLAAMTASFLAVGLLCWKRRNVMAFGLHSIVLGLMVVGYQNGLEPWMVAAMTPAGYLPQIHYGLLAEALVAAPLWQLMVRGAMLLLGQAAYLVVGSFGLVVLGAAYCALGARPLLVRRVEGAYEPAAGIALMVLLSVLVVLGIGAASHAPNPTRVDEWLYGRYSDPFVLPLIAIGLLAPFVVGLPRRMALAGVAAALLLLVGVAIQAMLGLGSINVIQSTPAFWPQYVVPAGGMLQWMALGALALAVVAAGGKRLALALLLSSFLVSSRAQSIFHTSILARDAQPSALVDIVRANFAPGTCIGYHRVGIMDTSDFRSQRFQLYKFSFFDYDYRRMSPEEWLSACDGPLFTLDAKQFERDQRVEIVAREYYSGLFLIVKTSGPQVVIPSSATQAENVFLAETGRENCLLAGCFSMNARELGQFSQVGRLNEGQLSTTGAAGALFYGPYYELARGRYFLILRGTFGAVPEAALDVVTSSPNAAVTGRLPLCAYHPDGTTELVIPFELASDAAHVEVRLWVSPTDELSITGYQIVSASDELRVPTLAGACR